MIKTFQYLNAMKKLSVIIPCYNESKTIRELLNQAIGASIGSWGKEIIVIDDGSSDGTKDILKEYEERIRVIYQEKNGGKGTAVSTGLKEATGDYVLIQDADLEYDPNDITKLLTKIDVSEADVVYGSRTLQQKKPTGRLIPRLGVWFITQLINTFYRLKLTDVWTCYKLFPRAAAGILWPVGLNQNYCLLPPSRAANTVLPKSRFLIIRAKYQKEKDSLSRWGLCDYCYSIRLVS